MNDTLSPASPEYTTWLTRLKGRLRQVQLKAAVAVNQELLNFYWELGTDIVEKQKSAVWGSGFLKQLSKDLRAEFPNLKGFSFSNIKYMRQWVLFYSGAQPKGQQLVGQIENTPVSLITQIP